MKNGEKRETSDDIETGTSAKQGREQSAKCGKLKEAAEQEALMSAVTI